MYIKKHPILFSYSFIVSVSLLICQCKIDRNASPWLEKRSENDQQEESKIHLEMKDTFFLIPLDQVYSRQMLQMIGNNEYYNAASSIIMGFTIVGDSLIFSNNESKTISIYSISNYSMLGIKKSPLHDDPVTKMVVANDSIICSTFFSSFEFDFKLNNFKVVGDRFSKGNVNCIWVLDGYNFVSRKQFPEVQLDGRLDSQGFDFIKNASNETAYFIFTNTNKGIELIAVNNKNQVEIYNIQVGSIDMSLFEDVDIIYSGDSEIKFIAKTGYPANIEDVFVTFNFAKNEVSKFRMLKTKYDQNNFLGDPAAFPTGSSYIFREGSLWCLRTTLKGICIEQWSVGYD